MGEPVPPNVKVVVTTGDEMSRIPWEGEHFVIYDEVSPTVDRALAALTGTVRTDVLVIGIDPGRRPGIAVLSGKTVVAVFQVNVGEVEPLLEKIAREYKAKSVLVRIGHGARLVTTQLINVLLQAGFKVELVDESGTTPHIGKDIHTSTVRDIIAAINIANIKGVPVGKQDIEPSRGEIRVIQETSRSVSEGRSTIPRYLARQVAKGELTLDEAMEVHKTFKNGN